MEKIAEQEYHIIMQLEMWAAAEAAKAQNGVS